MKIYYNPLDERCKSLVGGIRQNTEFTLNIFCQEDELPSDKFLILINRDGKAQEEYELTPTAYGWTIVLKIHETGLYFYRFKLGNAYIGRGDMRNAVFSDNAPSYQFTVYEESFVTPEWFKGGLMYQIFPDRFNKVGSYPIGENKILRDDWGATPYYKPGKNGKILNNDFFGGNFNGIIEKLPYLKELNVSVIYMNPIFESASNHRYDTGNYLKIDSLLGSKEDFKRLVAEAEKCGIRVILDGVFNHTGDNSLYFNRYGCYSELGAYQSQESPYYEWYNFTNFPYAYKSWWGIDTLPSINKNSQYYQNFILGEEGVLKTWLKEGIGGYRLDVADELPDFFLKKLRKCVKEDDPEAIIIGEVWEDASNKISYGVRREYFQGYELDSVMNYPLKNAIINFVLTRDNATLREVVNMLIDNYPKSVLDCLMNILGTHDTSRILTVLGNKNCFTKDEMSRTFLSKKERANAVSLLKQAAFLQYTLPGVPCVYYGDENGMEGYTDPFCRRCYDWNNVDTELRSFYKRLGEIRSEYREIFKDGVYKDLSKDNRVYIFKRSNAFGEVYVYLNNSDRYFYFNREGNLKELLSGNVFSNVMEIKPFSYGIVVKE